MQFTCTSRTKSYITHFSIDMVNYYKTFPFFQRQWYLEFRCFAYFKVKQFFSHLHSRFVVGIQNNEVKGIIITFENMDLQNQVYSFISYLIWHYAIRNMSLYYLSLSAYGISHPQLHYCTMCRLHDQNQPRLLTFCCPVYQRYPSSFPPLKHSILMCILLSIPALF